MSELIKLGVIAFFDILDVLIGLLPSAPFRAMLATLSNDGYDVLSYVNWFLPFSFASTCINAWLVCVLAYYIYKYLKQAIQKYLN